MIRPVTITATGLFASDAPGAIRDFQPREHLPDRKHAKLMSRGVQLGVAAVRSALQARPGWEAIVPERRGLFVGTSPGGGDPEDLVPAFEASAGPDGVFSLTLFGERGFPLVPPLWLVRGLSNNVVGFASAYHELRGPNSTRCDGRIAGLGAVVDAVRSVAEGRCDLALGGGSDNLVPAAAWFPIPVGEAGAFVVVEPATSESHTVAAAGTAFDAVVSADDLHGAPTEIGAASGVVELVRRLRNGERHFRIETLDPAGARAWLEIA